jgi:periplasmic protein CpxP/Spy
MRVNIILSAALSFIISFPVAADTIPPNSGAATGVSAAQGETVEERITNLHAELNITADEEKKWSKVAQAMGENASNMEKMIEKNQAQSANSPTAKDDLKTYQEFAQAHVNGLKNLRTAFDSLYDSMPEDQKKVADQVFQNSKH